MRNIPQTLVKSLLIGTVYMTALALTNLLLRGEEAQSIIWPFSAGVVIGLTVGLLASSMPATWTRHMLVWGSVIFLNITSVTIEGRFFAPNLVQGSLLSLIIQQLIVALATTWFTVKLFALVTESSSTNAFQRSRFSWIWRFVLSALSYIIFYYFFGAINYLLVTGPYYETHVGGLVVPAQEVILKAELIRAPMIILSIVPFLLTLSAGKTRLAVLTGLILFAVGGLVPLSLQVTSLPLLLLAASAVEIFFQNFSTGGVTALLLGKPE